MLEVKNLHAQVEDTPILKGISLEVKPGEIHAVMGPNGSGKSTLGKVIAGHEDYEVTNGQISYRGKDLLELEPEERAWEGVFLAFQYPVEIPGVGNNYFLRTALNSIRKFRDEEELAAFDFLTLAKVKAGGEKKRNEIFQMAVLEPSLAVLDETDSGLDIDALKIVADGVNSMRSPERSFLVITHYQRLLEYIVPDFVHVLHDGKIIRSGDKKLAIELEEKGYSWIEEEAATSPGLESAPGDASA